MARPTAEIIAELQALYSHFKEIKAWQLERDFHGPIGTIREATEELYRTAFLYGTAFQDSSPELDESFWSDELLEHHCTALRALNTLLEHIEE